MCEEEKFANILNHVDYVLYDLKLIDEISHIKYTGFSNKRIINNFKVLCNKKIPFCIRLPLIPTVTDTAKNINAIAQLMKENNQEQIEVLPYNKMAGGKYALVGRTYSPPFDQMVPIETHLDIFSKYGIKVTIL
jgi:pyruvate formate lyase activating enzyme